MLRSTLLLLLILVSSNIRAQELPPFYGEWWPDSVVVDGKHARQFLIILKSGEFYRCSYETERYVLDRALTIDEGKITRADGTIWTLTRLDKEHIVLKGPDYYGRFKLDHMQHITTMEEALNEFMVGDSVKQEILGKWALKSVGVELKEKFEEDEESQKYIDEFKQMVFLFLPMDEDYELEFSIDNEVIMRSKGFEFKRKYIVDDIEFNFIMSIDEHRVVDYRLHQGELWLSQEHDFFHRTLVFQRKE